MELTFTILGCGPSGGVPLIGCECATCTSGDPKNKRTRASILIEGGGTRVLVDTAPELRQQALREGFKTVDAILYTHAHADHLHGIDDARSFNYHREGAIPVIATHEVAAEVNHRFNYAFHAPVKGKGWLRPSLELQEIDDYSEFTVGNLHFFTYLQHHGKHHSTGYRIENAAYSTDVDNIPEQSAQLLESLDLWIVDCLQEEKAATHAHLEQTLGWIEQFKPKLAVLTHMAHQLEYEELKHRLPPGVVPAYDGMKIRLKNGHAEILATSPE